MRSIKDDDNNNNNNNNNEVAELFAWKNSKGILFYIIKSMIMFSQGVKNHSLLYYYHPGDPVTNFCFGKNLVS